MPARLSVLAALVALAACAEAPTHDPLDPGAIEDVAKSEGDAQGDVYSGSFRFAGSPQGCECPKAGFNLCAAGFSTFAVLDGIFVVTQADGYLTLWPKDAQGFSALSGAVDRDGSFELGAIYDTSNYSVNLTVYGRLSGEFVDPDTMVGDLDYRVLGDYDDEPVECFAQVRVEALRD